MKARKSPEAGTIAANLSEMSHEIAARNGVEHLGSAWLHGFDALNARPDPESGARQKTMERISANYDPESHDPREAEEETPPEWSLPSFSLKNDPFETACSNDLATRTRRNLLRLPAREERILRMHFGISGMSDQDGSTSDHPLRAIAELYDISPGRIRMLECMAIRRLKSHQTMHTLRKALR